jgi:hypothetical protein
MNLAELGHTALFAPDAELFLRGAVGETEDYRLGSVMGLRCWPMRA